MGDGVQNVAVCRLTMSKISFDSLSYNVPETLKPRVSFDPTKFAEIVGALRVKMDGGMKGLTGMGLGIRGEITDTRSDSLIRLVVDFGKSN